MRKVSKKQFEIIVNFIELAPNRLRDEASPTIGIS
jgi:hypothetical protein